MKTSLLIDKVVIMFKKLHKSIWLFPAIVIFIFLMLVLFRINGSSVGYYNEIINSNTISDSSLIAGKPRSIRSDEFVVVTPMLVAQRASNYPSTNQNIGNGQDMDILYGTPTHDWIQIFRPQNHAYYIIPFENAFAYAWWFSSVVLLISAYFFSLHFLKKKRLIASLLSIALYFTAFIQWWSSAYLIGDSLLLGLLFIYLVESKRPLTKVLLTSVISYLSVVFALSLYPPFQIPCAIAVGLFSLGYLINSSPRYNPLPMLSKNILYIIVAVVVAVGIVGVYLYQHQTVINTISNTAYPGKRINTSGKYSITHLLSGQLAVQHEKISTSSKYIDHDAGVSNQSETSSFIFLSIYLIIPLAYIVGSRKRLGLKVKDGPILVALGATFLLFFAWLFMPGLDLIGNVTKLNLSSENRLIIGFVIINYLATLMFIKIYSESKKRISVEMASLYAFTVFIAVLAVNSIIKIKMPGFIDNSMSILLAIPIPIIIYLLLRKRNGYALLGLVVFSMVGSIAVNPLYIGTGILTDNPIYKTIKQYPDNGRWAVEDVVFENFPAMANKRALSGTYAYPQLDLWKSIDQGKSIDRYNRYAHVTFDFDKNVATKSPTGFIDTGADQLRIGTEICSDFIKQSSVHYILSQYLYSQTDQTCIKDVKIVKTTVRNFYIYSLAY